MKRNMKKLLPHVILLLSLAGFSQTVTVPQKPNTASDLVNILLNNACVEVSNVQVSSLQSVAEFKGNGSNFTLKDGVVIRTGDASLSQGAYNGNGLSSQINSNSDQDLVQINQASGQPSTLTDVAFLEFEFVPLSSNFSFDFLFASNEYGQWQCVSSDVFAFLLTNLNTGQTKNLAVIPGTNTPISVNNIKDNAYNNSCPSDNAHLFGGYAVNNAQNSSMNMRGYTKVMTASSNITPGTPYRIKLAIADSNDSSFDSAIFLDAGSFSADLDLGEDKLICSGDSYNLSTGLDTSLYSHSWTFNGQVIPGVNQNSVNATQPGNYGVLVTKQGTNCLVTDNITIASFNYDNPQDIEVCYDKTGIYNYDLTANNLNSLNAGDSSYEIHYFDSLQNVGILNPIPTSDVTDYVSNGNQTIYIKFYNTSTGNYCSSLESFNLTIAPSLGLSEPAPIGICTMPGVDPTITLELANPLILNGQNETNFSFSYYHSFSDAENNLNEITNFDNYVIPLSAGSETFWVKVQSNSANGCSEIIEVEFELNDPPLVSELTDVVECESYILPSIAHGNYYSSPNGGGQQLPVGYEVTKSGTIYIFNGPNQDGCTNQTSFQVSIVKTYSVEEVNCGEFKVPFPPAGEFYTAQGGPNGSGSLIPSGSFLYQSQKIWFYAEVDGVFCTEKSFDITILPLPPVDEPNDVITCNSYTLPTLTNGEYFTKSNGKGQQLFAGHQITSTQKIYIYNDDGTCDNQHVFKVTIVPEFEDLVICGDYVLPDLPIGNYYTQAGGQGQIIADGSIISQSQTIYYYATTTTVPNCTENTSFYIQIKPIPPVDSLNDITLCEDETYTLPALVNGHYFTKSSGKGKELFAGEIISETKKIYIYNEDNGCDNQTSFKVEIRPFPKVSNFTDVYTCDSYELPEIADGSYYTESLKQGTQLQAGDFIDSTQTIYIYNEYSDLTGCYSEDSFTVYVEGIDLSEIEDVHVCESYVLPALEVGEYYSKSGKQGTNFYAGQIIFDTQEIYVYAKNGSRFSCESEISFTVFVAQPNLDHYQDIEACGSYELPAASSEGFIANYYWQPGAQDQLSESEYLFDEPGTYRVYIYAEAEENRDCYKEKAIDITIYERPQLYIEGGTICRNAETGEVESPFYLISGLDPTEFKVNWYLNDQLVHTGSEFEAIEAGDYDVEVEKINPEIGADCNYLPTTVSVKESGKPTVEVKVTEPFKDIANVNVTITAGYGEYQFSLDGSAFQDRGVFENVSSGTHQVEVRGKFGNCGNTIITIDVIKYPRFFTPNEDGYNDTWNIYDLKFDDNAKISIFDRFGKLLKVISPNGRGWAGDYHNKQMPSNEYWFVVDFVYEGQKRQFKSHFTLKK